MDWVVAEGVVPIPDDISFEEASFLEPLNTCLKALHTARLVPGETVVVFGQGPIGLMLAQSARSDGAEVMGVDLLDRRLEISKQLGTPRVCNPHNEDLPTKVAEWTAGRGADLAVVAAHSADAVRQGQEIVRRGGRVLLFAQTVPGEQISVDASQICVEEKQLIGSYSASVELQETAASLIFSRKVNVAGLISHRFPLDHFLEGFCLATHPSQDSLKVMIQP